MEVIRGARLIVNLGFFLDVQHGVFCVKNFPEDRLDGCFSK
jgi:hypothetical protein